LIRPEAWLVAYAINPSAVMGIWGAMFFGLLVGIVFLILQGSVMLWVGNPFVAASYLILSSVTFALLKKLIALRAKKRLLLDEKSKPSFSEISLSIPMFIALAVAIYLWIFGLISLIYTNFTVLLVVSIFSLLVYFAWDFVSSWFKPKRS
jgi:hypothetical protein